MSTSDKIGHHLPVTHPSLQRRQRLHTKHPKKEPKLTSQNRRTSIAPVPQELPVAGSRTRILSYISDASIQTFTESEVLKATRHVFEFGAEELDLGVFVAEGLVEDGEGLELQGLKVGDQFYAVFVYE